MKYLGDFFVSSIINFKFNTQTSSGSPITLAGTPLIRVYKNNVTTEDDSGITLTVDFDSLVGCHHVAIDLSSDLAFYAASGEYQVVLIQGTVNGISVAGNVLAHFSIENRPVDVEKVSGQAAVPDVTLTDDIINGISATYPANFENQLIDSNGRVSVVTNLDKTGYTVSTNQDKTGYTVSTNQDKTGYTVSANQDKTGYTVSANQDKTGYALSSSGLDSISTTSPSGVATNFREMVIQTWRRFFKKVEKTSTTITTYADNDTTVNTTQSISKSGSNETLGSSN